MARLSICLLGPYRVTSDGEPVTGFKTDKARALLAYLAVESGRPHQRTRLAGLLWPDSSESAARASLRVALGEVRRAVGDHAADPPHLLRSRQTIQFNSESDSWIDVIAFTNLMQAGGNLGRADPQAISQLEETVELYIGEFLQGFSIADSDLFDEWALLERGHLERLVLEALERLVEWYHEGGQIGRALPYAWRQVELDPFRERAHRQLMQLLALDGRRAAAVAQYEICRRILKTELDAEPDDQTTQLYKQIEAGELEPPPFTLHQFRLTYDPPPLPGPDQLPQPGHLPPGSRLPFIRNALFTGRREPLLALASVLLHGGADLTLVTQAIHGMGGIGKTQLAVEFAYRYGRFFHGVHWLDCAQPDAIAAQVAACGTEMNLPFWPEQQATQVRLTVQAWHRGAPRLVVLDNMEDTGAASEWLPRLAGDGVRLLLTARRRDWPLELGLVPLELQIFRPDESLAYLRQYLSPARASDGEIELLAGRLGHLPLALRLAGRYLARLRRLTVREYLARLSDIFADPAMKNWRPGLGDLGAHDLDLAASFLRSWQQVTDRPAQHLFRIAGYCAPNQPIPCELLETAAGLDRETCDEALSLLAALGLLDLADPAAGPTIHPLLAEFARALPALGAGAEQLEASFSPLPALVTALAQLSLQANEAGLPAHFIPLRPHLEVAAQAAEAVDLAGAAHLWTNLGYHRDIVADYAGAKAILERALKIHEDELPPEHPLLALTCNYLGIALHDLGDMLGARACYERAMAIAQAAFGPDHPNVACYVHSLGLVLRDQGELACARLTFERALALFERQSEPEYPHMAALINNLGELLRDLGDLAGARAACERALALDQAAFGPDHPKVARDLNSLGTVLRLLGDLVGAQRAFERALDIDLAIFNPDHHNVARDLHNLGTALQAMGDLAGAQATFEQALALFEEQHGQEHPHVATLANNLGEVLRDLGDLAGARAACERALAIDRACFGPKHPRLARDLNSLGTVLRNMGDLAGAQATFEQALAIDQDAYGSDHPDVARDINNLGRALQALGDNAGAQAAHLHALSIWEQAYGREHPDTAQTLWCLGTLAAETGSVSEARRYLEEALAIFQTFLPSHHPHLKELRTTLDTLPFTASTSA